MVAVAMPRVGNWTATEEVSNKKEKKNCTSRNKPAQGARRRRACSREGRGDAPRPLHEPCRRAFVTACAMSLCASRLRAVRCPSPPGCMRRMAMWRMQVQGHGEVGACQRRHVPSSPCVAAVVAIGSGRRPCPSARRVERSDPATKKEVSKKKTKEDIPAVLQEGEPLLSTE